MPSSKQAIAGRGSITTAAIKRAVERSEIDPSWLMLPVALVRHDLIMNQAPAPDTTLVEIVDRILLPFVRPQP